MIRFSNGAPQAIWYSQHASGQAFTYSAVEKKGIRPYAYSGNGTHANYVIAGYYASFTFLHTHPETYILIVLENTIIQFPASTFLMVSSWTTQTGVLSGTLFSMHIRTLITRRPAALKRLALVPRWDW